MAAGCPSMCPPKRVSENENILCRNVCGTVHTPAQTRLGTDVCRTAVSSKYHMSTGQSKAAKHAGKNAPLQSVCWSRHCSEYAVVRIRATRHWFLLACQLLDVSKVTAFMHKFSLLKQRQLQNVFFLLVRWFQVFIKIKRLAADKSKTHFPRWPHLSCEWIRIQFSE